MEPKNILIVGGSKGISKRLFTMLKDEGYVLYTAYRSSNGSTSIGKVIHEHYDAADPDDRLKIIPQKLHGLVYAPGSINLKPFHGLKDEDFQKDWNVNVLGAVRTIRDCLPALKKAGGASVVLFSTVAVQQGMAFHSSVAASKAAVEGLGRSLAAEFAPAKIRVNVIAPSLTDTPLAERLLSSEERRKASAERHPLKRIGKPEDIAEMAAFLLSDRSSWMTGQILHVDGGMSVIR